MPEATFSKQERLCAVHAINALFTTGHQFVDHPICIYWKLSVDHPEVPACILISVPKKRIPLASGRNRIKRLIRENYRLQKQPLLLHLRERNICIDIAVVYTSKKITSFNGMQTKIKVALSELILRTGAI